MCIYYGDCPFNMPDCEEDDGHYKCPHRVVGDMVRIRYWQQDTMESGRWCLTGLMTVDSAKKMNASGILDRSEIVADSDYT